MDRILRGVATCSLLALILIASGRAADPTDELLQALKAWETATADVPAPLPDALSDYRDTHNAHELDAAAELFGPVSARQMIEQYRWTLERQDSGDIKLHGEPRDATTSLFFSGVDVLLDGKTHRPAAIQFVAGDGEPMPTVIVMTTSSAGESTKSARRSDIQLVASLTEASDEPAPPRPLELAAVLKRWEEAVGNIHTAEIRFQRYVYDTVFRGEWRGTGRLLFEAPNLGVYELEPVDPTTDTRPARTDSNGGRYTLESQSRERWQWDGSRFWLLNLDHQHYDVVKIRETRPEKSWFDWDFLSDLKSPALVVPGVLDVSDDFLKGFQWELVRDDNRGLLLDGTPISRHNREQFKNLQVLIDRESFRTSATRAIGLTGSKETVHVFQYVSVNDDGIRRQSWVPDVSGLKLNWSNEVADGNHAD